MFTTMMLSVMLAITAQAAPQPSKPGGSAAHGQTTPATPPPAPTAPAPGGAGQAAKGEAGQVEIDHSPAARRDRDHRRAYYWQEYKRPHRRAGHRNAVRSGAPVIQGAPSPPVSIHAVHNLDATVTVTWVMPGGVIQEGDVFEVGRRQPGQSDFWRIGETTQPRFVDRQPQTLTSGTQYAVAVRRGNVWSPMSAVSSTRPNHPLTPQPGLPVKSNPKAPDRAAPAPQAKPTPAPTPAPSAPR